MEFGHIFKGFFSIPFDSVTRAFGIFHQEYWIDNVDSITNMARDNTKACKRVRRIYRVAQQIPLPCLSGDGLNTFYFMTDEE